MNKILIQIVKITVGACLVSLYFHYIYAQTETAPHALELTVEEQQWLREHPVIRVSPDSHYEPIEFIENGKHTGITGDYFELIAQKLGVKFELIEHAKWADTMKAMESGRIDIMVALQSTVDRRLKYNFTKPYLSLNSVMVTDKLNTNNKMRIDDLIGKKLAVVDGYFWGELIKKDYPEIQLVPVSDITEGLRLTALGTADAFLGSFAALSYYLNTQEITNLMVAGNAPYQINYGTAVRKDWPEFVAILDKVIASITQEQHEEIRSNWIKLDYEPPLISRQFTLFLLALLVIALFLAFTGAYISNVLRHKVREKTLELHKVNQELEHMVESRTQDLRRANDKLLSSKRDLTSTNRILEAEVNRDTLTRIPNRKRLKEVLKQSLGLSVENREPLSIIMADIDHFKALNDHYGHLIGDDCLIEVANCLNNFTKRGGEFVARFGGEEFIMVLPNLSEEEALTYANLVLEKVHALGIENIDSPTEKFVTLSIGVATTYPETEPLSATELVNRSDRAMYQAKKQGRNRAVAFSSIQKLT